MRHMGNSGKLAVVAAGVSVGLLVLTSITLEESALFAFLAVVAVGYVACIAEVFARRRYFALAVGGVGTSLFVGFSVAFLRMWGLAFNQDANALGTAVSTKDSDIYFFLAVAAGFGTLAVLFAGAVWPGRAAKTRPGSRRPAGRTTAARRPAPQAAGAKKATTTAGPAAARRTAASPTKTPAAGRAAPRTKTAGTASTAARAPAARNPAAKRATTPSSRGASSAGAPAATPSRSTPSRSKPGNRPSG